MCGCVGPCIHRHHGMSWLPVPRTPVSSRLSPLDSFSKVIAVSFTALNVSNECPPSSACTDLRQAKQGTCPASIIQTAQRQSRTHRIFWKWDLPCSLQTRDQGPTLEPAVIFWTVTRLGRSQEQAEVPQAFCAVVLTGVLVTQSL